MVELNKCPICESENSEIFLRSKDYFLTGEDFQINQCKHCGFLFTNPRPVNSKLPEYYKTEEYISHSNSNKGIINGLYHFVRNFTLSGKVSMIRKFKSSGSVLDIGSGTGEFLVSMQKQSFSVTGVEPDVDARNYAITTYSLNIYDENELDVFKDQSFEIITMWHVLEHVPDLLKRVQQIKRLLKSDGILIVAVPNPDSKDAIFYKNFWAAFDLPRHLYHFKKNDIVSLFKKVDMCIVKIQPMLFDSFYVSLLSEKYKSGSQKFFKPFLIGLWSNVHAFFKSKNYSSLIYIIKHKNT